MGGDEFLAFLPHADEDRAEDYISRFQANIDHLNEDVPAHLRVSCTAGGSVIRLEEGSDMDQCIRRSDMVMYERKIKRDRTEAGEGTDADRPAEGKGAGR